MGLFDNNTETTAVSNQMSGDGKAGLWGSVIGGVTGLVSGFNYKAQENQIALAQAQAEQARAMAEAENSPEKTKKNIIWIVAVVAVVIVVLILVTKKS